MNDKVLKFSEFLVKESLPQQSTVNQLKKIKSVINKEIGGDIGDKISDMNKQGANIMYIQNPIETGIQSYQDYEKSNRKKFKKRKR
jgi:hypothetical protein